MDALIVDGVVAVFVVFFVCLFGVSVYTNARPKGR